MNWRTWVIDKLTEKPPTPDVPHKRDAQDHLIGLVDGSWVRLCEDCFAPIVHDGVTHAGYVSPESNRTRQTQIGGYIGTEAIDKVVCKACWDKAASRVRAAL